MKPIRTHTRTYTCRSTVAACYLAYVTQSTFNFVSLLYLTFCNDYGLSLGQISTLIAVNFGTQLLTDVISTFAIRALGYRAAAILSSVTAALGLCGLALFPDLFGTPFAGLLVAMILVAVGAGLIEVIVSPLLEACPLEGKSGAMALLHSMYSWGQAAVILLSTLFFRYVGLAEWKTLALLWAILPLVTAVFFCFVPIYHLEADEKKTPARAFLGKRAFWLFLLLMTCSGASEMIMSQWASSFVESRLGLAKSLGDLLGPFLFALTMAISRTLYGLNGKKWHLRRVMTFSCLAATGGYLIAALSPIPGLALVGFVLCGVGISLLWPGTYSEAAHALPEGGVAMFALLALAGDVGCLSGPSIAGRVAEALGNDLRYAFLFALVFPVAGLLCLLLLGRKKTEPSDEP